MYTTSMTTRASRLLAFAALLLWAVTAHAFPVGSASVSAPPTPPKKALMGENRPGSNCSGEQLDANVKFYYLRARWMDPRVGRFVSVDPYEGCVRQTLSLHRYLYAHANPVTFTDPSGQLAYSSALLSTRSSLNVSYARAVSVSWSVARPYVVVASSIARIYLARKYIETVGPPGGDDWQEMGERWKYKPESDCNFLFKSAYASCTKMTGGKKGLCLIVAAGAWTACMISKLTGG